MNRRDENKGTPSERGASSEDHADFRSDGCVCDGIACQYSLSYDNGANFHVIESIIGGCLVDSKTFQVKIPDNAPGGEAM